jgi:putative molybdopterin biosynthesis protein
MDLSNLYTVNQVADYLHVSRSTIYSLVRRGHLASISVGKHKRFTAQQVKEYLNTHGRVIVVQ